MSASSVMKFAFCSVEPSVVVVMLTPVSASFSAWTLLVGYQEEYWLVKDLALTFLKGSSLGNLMGPSLT